MTLKSRLGVTQGHCKWHHTAYEFLFVFYCTHCLHCRYLPPLLRCSASNIGVTFKILIWIRKSLRSLKMAPIDRLCTTLYWSAFVTISILHHFTVILRSIYRDLEMYVGDIVAHWQWYLSIDRVRVPIRLPL